MGNGVEVSNKNIEGSSPNNSRSPNPSLSELKIAENNKTKFSIFASQSELNELKLPPNPKSSRESFTPSGYDFSHTTSKNQHQPISRGSSKLEDNLYSTHYTKEDLIVQNSILNKLSSALGNLGVNEIRSFGIINNNSLQGNIKLKTDYGDNLLSIKTDQGNYQIGYTLSDSKVLNNIIDGIYTGELKKENIHVSINNGKASVTPNFKILDENGPISFSGSINSKFNAFDKQINKPSSTTSTYDPLGLNRPLTISQNYGTDNDYSLLSKIVLHNDPSKNEKVVLCLGNKSNENIFGIQLDGNFLDAKTSAQGTYQQLLKPGGHDELIQGHLSATRGIKGFLISGNVGGFHLNPDQGKNHYGLNFNIEIIPNR